LITEAIIRRGDQICKTFHRRDYPICRAGRSFGSPRERESFGRWYRKLEDPVYPEFVRELQESTIVQPVPQEFFETIVQESLKLPTCIWNEVVRCTIFRESSTRSQP
jgi:hypothetical protein